jgi:two-component system phosphate regulon response regulator PhoB
MPSTVLIVSDKFCIYEPIWLHALNAGYKPKLTDGYSQAGRMTFEDRPDALILDYGIQGGSALSFLHELRSSVRTRQLPVIVVSLFDEESECIAALEGGADDYFTLPLSMPELFARVRAVTRRRSLAAASGPLSVGSLTLIPASRRVISHAREKETVLAMSPTAFGIFHLMCERVGRVISRGEVLRAVWGNDFPANVRIVDVHIARLRSLLRTAGGSLSIETIKHQGYRLTTSH